MKKQNKKVTKKKRKNPPPNFYREIQLLIHRQVEITCRSDLGFFNVQDVLYPTDDPTRYKIVRNFTTLHFDLTLVKEIYENKIILKNSISERKVDKIIALEGNEAAQVRFITGRQNRITVNEKQFLKASHKNVPLTIVNLNMKYNSDKKIFYANTYDMSLVIWFKFDAVYDEHNFNWFINI